MKTFEDSAAQGDLLIMKVDKIPDDAVEKKAVDGKLIVAHSETGHHHFVKQAEARFFETPSSMICYLRVDESAELIHDRPFDTHETINIPAGDYIMRRQREHTPEGWRRIED